MVRHSSPRIPACCFCPGIRVSKSYTVNGQAVPLDGPHVFISAGSVQLLGQFTGLTFKNEDAQNAAVVQIMVGRDATSAQADGTTCSWSRQSRNTWQRGYPPVIRYSADTAARSPAQRIAALWNRMPTVGQLASETVGPQLAEL